MNAIKLLLAALGGVAVGVAGTVVYAAGAASVAAEQARDDDPILASEDPQAGPERYDVA